VLRLRKVDLVGFKSFCEKTHISFSGTGITCIVGPNGCGKSNIVDAISWVLGEQSHKSLRAERMSDCISNGTAKRPPMGMAEVSLSLIDPELAEAANRVLELAAEEEAQPTAAGETPAEPDPAGPGDEALATTEESREPQAPAGPPRRRASQKPAIHLKPGEVVITRRLYRSGQSDYLINGRTARLRDIQELFMGMGLGPDSYAIIEQGRIGQILSSKPMERRAILEEAAGISKFKTKKRLAEAKLESSKLNLARVNDILVEVEKQLASLKRQAAKARRYSELKEEMRGLLRGVLASRARELDAEAERLANQLRAIGESESSEARALEALEGERERLESRSYELDAELRQNQNHLGQCALELDRAENRIGFNRQRLEELARRGGQLAEQIAQAEAQAKELDALLRGHQESLVALREQTAEVERNVRELAAQTAERAGTEQALETRLAQIREERAGLAEEAAQAQAAEAEAQAAAQHHAEALAREQEGEKQCAGQAAELIERAGRAANEFEIAAGRAAAAAEGVERLQSEIASLRREQQAGTTRAEERRDALAGSRARHSSLEQILADRAHSTEAVQKLFAANGEGEAVGFRAVGLLADYAEVAPEYETPVEQFLRDEMDYVVVETFDHARAGIALLRNQGSGRATFFVDSLSSVSQPAEDASLSLVSTAGVVSRLDRLVEFRQPLGTAAKRFLPRLASAYLVETAGSAEQLARANPEQYFVTLDGTCYHGRTVAGGRPGEAGPLALKRELRDLDRELSALERAGREAQEQLARLDETLRRTEAAVEQALAEQLEAERALVARTHQRDQARAERDRAAEELDRRRREIARLENDQAGSRERSRQATESQEKIRALRAGLETEEAETLARFTALRDELLQQQETLSTRRQEHAALTERLASIESAGAQLSERLRESEERRRELAGQQEAAGQERTELETSTREHAARLEALRTERARLEERSGQLEQQWNDLRARLGEADERLRGRRTALGEFRDRRAELDVQRARNDADRTHLRETCLAEMNAHPEELAIEDAALLTGEALAEAEARQRELRSRIETMGPINMVALEEYQQCDERYGFLSRERDDLVASITDTQQAIAELDAVSREKFAEAFVVINRNFAEAFQALFGGGTGEMRLGETDGTSEPGLDIVAQPPGKRLQNVMLLSGGEKALTALALLIAIFRYQPSPFCILDEVDAPLDESNVSRFNNLLAAMGEQTQFIVVTHNRRTMEMAPALYGVTMQEPGVSKLVSVRWDEAHSTAA
jgi:chromosome segregation protein